MMSKLFGGIFSSPRMLSYNELKQLVVEGVINAPLSSVNGSSIDLTLHHIIRKEVFGAELKTIRLYKGESIATEELDMNETRGEHIMMPDAFVLGSSVEIFYMPDNLSASFHLKSSIARNALEHLNAGHIDPGFHGTLTLEIKNMSQFQKLAIAPGMKAGQVCFYRHKRVPLEHSYSMRGQYNGCSKVQESKGIR